MYQQCYQMTLDDFDFPFGKLDPENEWVKLAALVPWGVAEVEYAKQFVNNGHPAHSVRIALGALIIKQKLKCSDDWVVRHVSENPYLQFFIGLKSYTNKCPFGASTMVEFRKRFPPQSMANILAASVPKNNAQEPDHPVGGSDDNTSEPKNSGTILMDATCCPADVAFPQDFKLLNDAREHLEHIVDELCAIGKLKRPRMKRKCARRDFLNLSKSKKRSAKKIRGGIRRQLQYIHRDLGFITDILQTTGMKLTKKQTELFETITTLYDQQLYMYTNRTHSVKDRIVSLSQPWIRPIVRGKAHANTEFGAKLHLSMVDGYAKIERLSFDPFNETSDFFAALEGYRREHGFYPARVLADKIYRNRQTLSWCKERNIQMTGPALGRPPKDHGVRNENRKQEYQDICDRNIIEGEFGVGKRSYGLNRIMAHLPETSFCVIGIALLCMNLAKTLKGFFCAFFNMRFYELEWGFGLPQIVFNVISVGFLLWMVTREKFRMTSE